MIHLVPQERREQFPAADEPRGKEERKKVHGCTTWMIIMGFLFCLRPKNVEK